jgi:hypothetical protein
MAGVAGRFLAQWLAGKLKPELKESTQPKASTLPERLLAGGYPEPNRRTVERARQWHRQYLASIIERDVRDVSQVKDGRDVGRLLEFLAHRTAELLNVSAVANALQLDRATVERHMVILEKLFLIRRLPAWSRNAANRLIKTSKVHIRDCGLAGTLGDLRAEDWNGKRERFGHLLESFVLQELQAQAGWTDPDLRFHHYRDKDQIEVDCVITRGTKVWGVEVKAAATVDSSDSKGLRRLAAQAGTDFQGGIVFYNGDSTLALGDGGFFAVPLAKLWEM